MSHSFPLKRRFLAVIVMVAALLVTACGVEPIFTYQGVLNDGSGDPVPDGSYSATFRLYHAATGGSAVFTDTRTLTVQDGLFNTEIGDADVPAEIYAQPTWLEVTIDGETLTPRQPLRGAPYAFSLTSGAIVQGNEVVTRTLFTRDDTGAALAVANLESGTDGGHGLLAMSYSTNHDTAALAGIAQDEAYAGYFYSENYRGIHAESDPIWFAAHFEGSINVTGSCVGCVRAQVAQNVGAQPIEPGDWVAVAGVHEDADLGVPVVRVRRATAADPYVLGVADGAMTRTVDPAAKLGRNGFDPTGGTAAPDSYLAVIVDGMAQARVAPDAAIRVGDWLRAGEAGATVTARAPADGLARALAEPSGGLVWVMVGGR